MCCLRVILLWSASPWSSPVSKPLRQPADERRRSRDAPFRLNSDTARKLFNPGVSHSTTNSQQNKFTRERFPQVS